MGNVFSLFDSWETTLQKQLKSYVNGGKIDESYLKQALSKVKPDTIYSIIDGTRNSKKQTAIHFAALEGKNGMVEVIFCSIKTAENLIKLCKMRDAEANSPIHCAALKTHHLAVRALLEKIPHTNVKEVLEVIDSSRSTALHNAIRSEQKLVVEEIVASAKGDQHCELLRKKNGEGSTPLHYAMAQEDLTIFRKVVYWIPPSQAHTFFRIPNESGTTSLHIAIENHCKETIQWLVQSIPGAELFEMLKIPDGHGERVIFQIVRLLDVDEMRVILTALPAEEVDLCLNLDNRGKSVKACAQDKFGEEEFNNMYNSVRRRRMIV